jgi:hypothetical protein
VGERPWLDYVTISNPEGDRAVRRVRDHPAALLDRARAVVPRLWTMRRLVFGVGAAELLVSRC